MPVPNIPKAPHISPNVRVGMSYHEVEPNYYGPKAHSDPKAPVPQSSRTSSSTASLKTPTLKAPVPAKALPLETYTMSAATTPSPKPTSAEPQNSQDGLFGWSIPAEAALFVALALICITIPTGLYMYLRRRKRLQMQKDGEDSMGNSLDGNSEGRGSFTRPTTASSTWLETLKHRTETPAPPHTCEGRDEIIYEPPRPITWKKFRYPKKRLSDAEIEQEVRELELEVKRKSRASRASRTKLHCSISDAEKGCGECALAYTTDERGHTQPVEGRKATPIPFAESFDLKPSPLEEVVKADEIRIACAEIPEEVDLVGGKS